MIKNFIIYFFGGFILISLGAFLLPVVAIKFGFTGLVVGVIAFIALVLFSIFFIMKQVKIGLRPKVIPNGMPAVATVVKSYQGNTKMTIGGVQEIYQLIIEVNVSNNYESWPAKMKEMIPLTQVGMFQPGLSFKVKYDPNDKSKIVFDNSDEAQQQNHSVNIPGFGTINSQNVQSAMQAAPQDITLRLQASNALLKELASTGVACTATVLSSDLMYGNYMPGADVYQLKLQINSTEITPFDAEQLSLISKVALHKIQPGNTVYVRYDRNHPQRLVMTGTDKPGTAVQF